MASSGRLSMMLPSPIAGVLPSGSLCSRTSPAAGIVVIVDSSGPSSTSGAISSRPLSSSPM